MAEPEATHGARRAHVLAERREKLERLREDGRRALPARVRRARTEIATVRAEHDGLEPGEETDRATASPAGSPRAAGTGKSAFIDLVDGSGRIQLHSRVDGSASARTSS